MYIKYLQIALNYRTRCRLPRTAKCTAYHQGRGRGEMGNANANANGSGRRSGIGRSEATSAAPAIVVCSTYNLSGWTDQPSPSPAQPKQSGWTEACLSIPLTNGISQYQSLCLSRSPSIHLAILVDCPTLHSAVNLAHGVQICFDLLRVPAAVATWIPMDTSHCALWLQQWSQIEREVVEKILPKVEDKV